MKGNLEARSADASERVLCFFGWENSRTRTLAIVCHVIWGVVLLALSAVFLAHLDQSYYVVPDDYSTWGCGSAPFTLADGAVFLIFLNVIGAVFGAFIYSARSIEIETSSDSGNKNEVVMKEAPERIDRDSPLIKIKIAAPCKAEWRFMYGDDRARFCGQCNLNVYNLSALTREEAEDLIRRTEGRLCVRFYRRKDGTILTRNCPVGLRAIKERVSRISTAIAAALIGFLANLGLLWWIDRNRIETGVPPVPIASQSQPHVFAVTGEVVGRPILPETQTIKRGESFIRQRAILQVMPTCNGQASVKGNVVVRITISEEGDVIGADCISGHPLLMALAEDAAYGWKFRPVLYKDSPVRVRSQLTLRF